MRNLQNQNIKTITLILTECLRKVIAIKISFHALRSAVKINQRLAEVVASFDATRGFSFVC